MLCAAATAPVLAPHLSCRRLDVGVDQPAAPSCRAAATALVLAPRPSCRRLVVYGVDTRRLLLLKPVANRVECRDRCGVSSGVLSPPARAGHGAIEGARADMGVPNAGAAPVAVADTVNRRRLPWMVADRRAPGPPGPCAMARRGRWQGGRRNGGWWRHHRRKAERRRGPGTSRRRTRVRRRRGRGGAPLGGGCSPRSRWREPTKSRRRAPRQFSKWRRMGSGEINPGPRQAREPTTQGRDAVLLLGVGSTSLPGSLGGCRVSGRGSR